MNEGKCKQLILNMVNFYTIYEKEFLELMPYISNEEISPLLSRMLNEIHIQGKVTSSRLSKIMKLSLPNTSRSINALYKMGYVVKNQDKKDRRVVYISLSDKGLKLMLNYIYESEEKFLKKLEVISEKDIDKLNEAFSSIRHVLLNIRRTKGEF